MSRIGSFLIIEQGVEVNSENIFEVIENYVPKSWEIDKNIDGLFPREEEYEFDIGTDFYLLEYVLNKVLFGKFYKNIFKSYNRDFIRKCILGWDFNEDIPVILSEKEVLKFNNIISSINEESFYENINVKEMHEEDVRPLRKEYKEYEEDYGLIKQEMFNSFKILKQIYNLASKYNCKVIVYYG